MNVQDEIKALKERIAELEEQAKEEQEFPKDGDEYWYIDIGGDVLRENWESLSYDRDNLEIGNVFRAKEQAQLTVEKLKVEAELRKYSKPYEHGGFNYYLFFDIENDCLDTLFTSYCPPQGVIYFESEEKAQQAIKSVGKERIKKYIFGVGER